MSQRSTLARSLAALLAVVILGANETRASSSDPLPRAVPEDVGLSSERLTRLASGMNRYTEERKIVGSVVLVARRGKIVFLEAYGERDREARDPMHTDTIFRIASQTKALVITGAMELVEQGKLLLSDPVAKYLPEFRDTTVAVPRAGGGYNVVKALRPITIRDLMTHTSGIGYGLGIAADQWKAAGIQGWYFADRNEPMSAVVSRMAALPFDAQPGERWVYGYGIDVLGVIVERVSGLPLDVYLRTNIIEPLGMRDTSFYLPKEKRQRLAAVYSDVGKSRPERAPDPGGMIGQGAYVDGLLSTAEDYARFLQMLLNGGRLDGERLLSRKSVELMTTDHIGKTEYRPGLGEGLGFYVVQDVGARGDPGSLGEYGWGGAYHSTYWVDPKEQLVVVYLAQLHPGDVDDFGTLRALVYQAIID